MPSKSLIISNSKFAEIIDLKDIVLFVGNGSYSEVILENNKKILASKNLHWFEQKAGDSLFFRVHKSYIVNIKFVSKIFHSENKIGLRDGSFIPLSRSKKQAFWEKMESFTFRT